MRHTLLLMAGTLLFFAIATLPVSALLGDEHRRALWAGGLVSLTAVVAGSVMTRLAMRWFEDGPRTTILLGPVVRLFFTLAALVVVPRLVPLDLQAFGAWLIGSYLVILFVESGFLASQQQS